MMTYCSNERNPCADLYAIYKVNRRDDTSNNLLCYHIAAFAPYQLMTPILIVYLSISNNRTHFIACVLNKMIAGNTRAYLM